MAERKRGRPTKYKPEYDEQALKLCRLGATDKELADFFKATEQTINNWKIDHPSFFESLKVGKDEHDTKKVEGALLSRALGVTLKETKVMGGGGDDEDPSAIETIKEIPPDSTACIFWLKNRNPDRWRDKQEQVIEERKVSIIDLTGSNAD